MERPFSVDEPLMRRLPLPLAQLYRRAVNAKTALERHLTAYYLWEAALKLLSAGAVVAYVERDDTDADLAERLKNLARPSLGHWWEWVRRLVPVLADAGDPAFDSVRDLVLGKSRDDLPRAAGLDAALREALDGKGGARSTVYIAELFDRLVRYRNQEIGHGAAGQRSGEFYAQMGSALLAGVVEVLGRLDVLAGRRLLYISDVRRQAAGTWLVERHELIGETAPRIESLDLPESAAADLPRPERVYLASAGQSLCALHPLAVYDADLGELLFLNSRRGRRRSEYLSYTSGRVVDRADLGGETRELLARVLDVPVADAQIDEWQARSQAEEPAAESSQSPAERHLGEFELLSELGKGGMGKVYRAWQPSLGRQVALKELMHTGDARSEGRFAREVRALGRVEHPHLVKIFTSGSEADHWYYAMELVEGATLAAICERLATAAPSVDQLSAATWEQALSSACVESRQAEKPLSDRGNRDAATREHGDAQIEAECKSPCPRVSASPRPGSSSYVAHVVELVRQIAGAAHALHEGGVIHRDIKPGNIMVGVDGRQAVLMDLGLAQLADDVEGRLTRTRQFVGTLRYASPEQVLAVGRLDRRSDVYSLGATLWELLTLRPLYGATDATPTPDLMQWIQYREVERLSKYHPRISRDLEAVVQKCLEKDPSRRYATAREFAEDLQRYLNREPVLARPVGDMERAWRWCRRNRALSGALAAVVVCLVAGTVVATLFAFYATSAKLRADYHLYASEMHLASLEAEAGQMGLVRQRLQAFGPRRSSAADLRGFEWYYLNRLLHLELRTLRWRADSTTNAFFSADGRHIAFINGDRTVQIYDLQTRHENLALKGRIGNARSVWLNGDGICVESWESSSGHLRVWDLRTGHQIIALKDYFGSGPMAVSRDGRRVAVAYNSTVVDNSITLVLWDATTRQKTHSLKGHTSYISSVTFNGDGSRVASGSLDGTVWIWDSTTGERLLKLTGHSDRVSSVTFGVNDPHLASASQDGTVRVWNVETGEELRILRGHSACVNSVAFSPDGRRIATGSDDWTLRLWDAATGKETLRHVGHAGRVRTVAFDGHGRLVTSASEDGTVRTWDAAARGESLILEGHSGAAQLLAFSPDSRQLATTDVDGTVRVWDVTTGLELQILKGHSTIVESVAFGADGRQLTSISTNGRVTVWDVATGKEDRSFEVNTHLGVLSADRRLIALVGEDAAVTVHDAATLVPVLTLKGHTDHITCVAFTTDARRIASGSYDLTIRMWDVRTGEALRILMGHTDEITKVAFSPDGRRLASASLDRSVNVWDTATGQQTLSLKKVGTGRISSLAFSPDGYHLAVGSKDGNVFLYSATELTPALIVEREVRSLLTFLYRTQRSLDDVHAAIRRDRTIDDEVRRVALERAAVFWNQRVEVAAQKAVAPLFHKYSVRSDVMEAIRSDQNLDAAVRARALTLAEGWWVDPNALDLKSRELLSSWNPSLEKHKQALRLAEEAFRLAPGDRNIADTLRLAQYRAGKYQDALTTINRVSEHNAKIDGSARLTDLAFQAMAHFQLGQKDEARSALQRLRELMNDPKRYKDEQSKTFLREAEELIEGKKGTGGK